MNIKTVREQLKDAKEMLEDKLEAEMKEMVKEEVHELEAKIRGTRRCIENFVNPERSE